MKIKKIQTHIQIKSFMRAPQPCHLPPRSPGRRLAQSYALTFSKIWFRVCVEDKNIGWVLFVYLWFWWAVPEKHYNAFSGELCCTVFPAFRRSNYSVWLKLRWDVVWRHQ